MSRLNYPTTALEDWVTNLYKRLGIVHPSHIKEVDISRYFGIYIKHRERPSYYFINGRYMEISIDVRKTEDIQREMFFHELCHILRHSGNQLMMPQAFRELQEWDTRRFTRYAAIPHHMLRFIDIEDSYVIDQMTSIFKVTPELCMERILQVQKRIEVMQNESKSQQNRKVFY